MQISVNSQSFALSRGETRTYRLAIANDVVVESDQLSRIIREMTLELEVALYQQLQAFSLNQPITLTLKQTISQRGGNNEP